MQVFRPFVTPPQSDVVQLLSLKYTFIAILHIFASREYHNEKYMILMYVLWKNVFFIKNDIQYTKYSCYGLYIISCIVSQTVYFNNCLLFYFRFKCLIINCITRTHIISVKYPTRNYNV